MTRGLGAGLMKVLERRSAQFELASRLEADVPVGSAQGDDVAVLDHRLPAIFGQSVEQVADPAGLVVARRAMVAHSIDELLMLGADAPPISRLFAARENGNEILAALDGPGIAVFGARRHSARRLAPVPGQRHIC